MSINSNEIIQIKQTITGISESFFNLSNITLLTNEFPKNKNNDNIYVYENMISVEKDFGTNSLTYKTAQSIFGTSSNILSASGKLFITSVEGVTEGTAPIVNGSSTIESNLTNFQEIISTKKPTLSLNISGVVETFIFDSFNGKSAEVVFNSIKNKLAEKTLILTNTGTGVAITSNQIGSNNTILVQRITGDDTIEDISSSNFLNILDENLSANGTDGNVATVGQNIIVQRLKDTIEKYSFSFVLSNLKLSATEVVSIAKAISQDKLYLVYPVFSKHDISFYNTEISDSIINNLILSGSFVDFEEDQKICASAISLLLSNNPYLSGIQTNKNYQKLYSGLSVNSSITNEISKLCSDNNIALFYANFKKTFGNVVQLFNINNIPLQSIVNSLFIETELYKESHTILASKIVYNVNSTLDMNRIASKFTNILSNFKNSGLIVLPSSDFEWTSERPTYVSDFDFFFEQFKSNGFAVSPALYNSLTPEQQAKGEAVLFIAYQLGNQVRTINIGVTVTA